jgi:ribosomal-protein-alanine N-acetyltransferase
MAKYIIETQRCILRPPIPDDVDEWAAKLYADPDVMRYLPRRDMTPRQLAERRLNRFNAAWENHPHGGWAIITKADQQVIGNCGLEYIPGTDEVELGYAIAKTHWGQGITTEVARACVCLGFETAKLTEIIGLVVPENTASWRVLQRVGFVFVKNAVYYDLDVVYYKIKADQFTYGDFFYQARRLDEQP